MNQRKWSFFILFLLMSSMLFLHSPLGVAQEEGFELKETIKLALSSVAGKGIKFEPIFIFSKKQKR